MAVTEHSITVYRPRLERITVKVKANGLWEAREKAYDKAETSKKKWELLPSEAHWFIGEADYNEEMFIPDSKPRLFDGKGNSTEV